MITQEKRGYFSFKSYFLKSNNKSEIWFWSLKINNEKFYGNDIFDFINFIDNLKLNCTLWSFKFDSIDYNFLAPALLLMDYKYQYFHSDENIKLKKKKNLWTSLMSEYNKNLNLIFYNKNGFKITFLSGQLTLGTDNDLNYWGESFDLFLKNYDNINEDIFFLEIIEIKKRFQKQIDIEIEILEKSIEWFLKILDYKNNNYKMTLASYASWYWKNNSLINLKPYFFNQIENYELWLKLWNSLKGAYIYFNDFYLGKVIQVINPDMKSAYSFQLISNSFPIFKPIECFDENCQHDLSIISYQYFNYKKKNGFLPIFTIYDNDEKIKKFSYFGNYINWPTIEQEHDLIEKHYNFESKTFNWKICFDSNSMLFHQYFKKWYILKEKFKKEKENLIFSKVAKSLNNSLWGFEGQKPVRNNKIFQIFHYKDLIENYSYIKYNSYSKDYFYYEKIIKKEEEPEKWFKSPKCKYIPISIFTTAYQRIDMINIAQMNYDNIIEIHTDSITLKYGSKLIFPDYFIQKLNNRPQWAKDWKLGEFDFKKKKY